MNEDRLTCALCGHPMDWTEAMETLVLPQVQALRPGEELVLARCPDCGHEVSIEYVDLSDPN